MIARGSVWWADLGLPRGSGPALRRPVVVVSDDRYNASQLNTVVVVALTSNLRLAALPGNVTVPADVVGLTKDSVVNVTQIAAIDRTLLEEQTGRLPAWLIAQVDDGLRRSLSLNP